MGVLLVLVLLLLVGVRLVGVRPVGVRPLLLLLPPAALLRGVRGEPRALPELFSLFPRRGDEGASLPLAPAPAPPADELDTVFRDGT